MQTIEMKVYNFSELSESARERVKQDYESTFGYVWERESMESLQAFIAHFDSTLAKCQIEWSARSESRCSIDSPEMSEYEMLTKINALGTGQGDCTLTGYTADEDLIDGFRSAWNNGERDLYNLLQSAFESWLKACQADYKDFYSDSIFGEHCDSNGYLFFSDGESYHGR